MKAAPLVCVLCRRANAKALLVDGVKVIACPECAENPHVRAELMRRVWR